MHDIYKTCTFEKVKCDFKRLNEPSPSRSLALLDAALLGAGVGSFLGEGVVVELSVALLLGPFNSQKISICLKSLKIKHCSSNISSN